MYKLKTIILLLLIAISSANAQIITLNYNDFSSSDCDVFASQIPVQGILHETKVGDITKNSSVGAIQLKYEYNNGGSNQKGSEFAITHYTFKKDYKYRVKITARNNNSYSEPAGIKCNFNPSGIDFQCNGPNFLNSNNGTFSSNNNWFQIVNGTSFTEYTFESDYLSSAQTNLGIGTYSLNNIGQNSEWNQIIYIKKIEIIELPPPPSFSLSPSTLSLGCGDVGQRTFTVNPSNIPSGATVTYSWSHPGWTLISSTATTRTLQPSSSTALPSNVTVTPSINGVAQSSKTCTVSRAPFTDNTSSITGQTALCSTGTYTYNINNPSNHNISWTLSNSNVANIISQTNSQVIVNVNNPNGVFTINATVTNNCNQSVSKSLNCSIGAPILSFSGNPTFCKSDYQREDNSIVLNTSNFSISEFEWFTGNFVGEPIQTCALPIINTFNNKAYFQAPDLCMGTIRVRARNNCGWSEWLLIDVPVINCKDIEGPRSGDIYEFRTANPLNEKEITFSIYPNPTSDFISIEISSFEKSKYSTEFHAEIFDFMGNKIKSFAIIESITKVNVSELKNGIHFIKIRTEKEQLTYKIVKK